MSPAARRALAALALAAASLPAAGALPPSRMMANVYLLAEAGATLEVCRASPAFGALPAARAREIEGFAARLDALARAIGKHYGDDSLGEVYAATRARLAGDTRLKFHLRQNYEYCGERLAGAMRDYLRDHEALFDRFFTEEAQDGPER